MEKGVYISMLLEMYGQLLTKKQADIVDLYYNQNLSLTEIAENLDITRQGVRKTLVDAEDKLEDLEKKLNLLSEKQKRQILVESLIASQDILEIKSKLINLL